MGSTLSFVLSFKPSLYRLFRFLRRPEHDLLARLNLYGFAGRRLAPHPDGTLPHLEDVEAGQPDLCRPSSDAS